VRESGREKEREGGRAGGRGRIERRKEGCGREKEGGGQEELPSANAPSQAPRNPPKIDSKPTLTRGHFTAHAAHQLWGSRTTSGCKKSIQT
jgi:hypothetical protein